MRGGDLRRHTVPLELSNPRLKRAEGFFEKPLVDIKFTWTLLSKKELRVKKGTQALRMF